MKINYDYYNGKDEYCDGEVEKDILNYAKINDKKRYNEIFFNDMRWPVFYHFSYIRENILNWYPFKANSDILEIGAGMGAITGVLCKKAKHVTAVELSKQRASVIAEKHKKYDNLEIIVGNLNDIKFNKKFDYITLIGVLEYANMFTNSDTPFDDFLSNIRKLLKPDGKLLIAIENKFGIKYFAGAVEDHTSIRYDSIIGYCNKKGPITYGKKELTELLVKNGLCNVRFYYPLPDYKLPNVIFSDECLPTEKDIDNLYDVYYYDNTILNFDEKKAYKEIIKENKFDFFANSFFIECSACDIEKKIDFAVFNSKNEFDDLFMVTKSNDGIYEKEKLDIYNNNKKEIIQVSDNSDIIMKSMNCQKKENEQLREFFSDKYITEENYINNLKNIIEKHTNELNLLKEELEKIYHSRTWKYTNIIRKINKKIKFK